MRIKVDENGNWRSFRHRNFRILYPANAASNIGTWAQRVAQDWLVLELTNNNGFYLVSKRAIGDFLAENVNGVTNPTSGSSGYEGPRRGVGVFNTPGGQFVTDRFAATASSTVSSDGGTWTPAIGDLLTVAAASGNAGKLVQLDPAAVQTDGIAVGRVDSYDSATGLLYFTQLSAV